VLKKRILGEKRDMLNRKTNRIYTILAITLLLSSLLLVRLNLPTSAQEEDNLMYLHGPPTTPIHMHNNEPLVPIHLNSNMTLTPIHMHYHPLA